MQKETFSKNMRMALAMKAKTQHSLAVASGLHPSRIIAEALQVPVTWLFEDHAADLGTTV